MIPPGAVGADTNARFIAGTTAPALREWGAVFVVKYACRRFAMTDAKHWHADEYDEALAAGMEPVYVNEWYTAAQSTKRPPVGSILRNGTGRAAVLATANEDFGDSMIAIATDTPHAERKGALGYAEDEDFYGQGTEVRDAVTTYGGEMQRLQRLHTDCPFLIYTGGNRVRQLNDQADKSLALGFDVRLVDIWWQASAWSGASGMFREPESHLLQTSQHDVGGITVDLNTTFIPWAPTRNAAPVPPVPQGSDMAKVYDVDSTIFLVDGGVAVWLWEEGLKTDWLRRCGQAGPEGAYKRDLAVWRLAGRLPDYPADWPHFRVTADMFCPWPSTGATPPPPPASHPRYAGRIDIASVPGTASVTLDPQ